MRKNPLLNGLLIGVLALSCGGIGWIAAIRGATQPADLPENPPVAAVTNFISVNTTPLNRETAGTTSYAPVLKHAAPAVVNVFSIKRAKSTFPELRPFFRRFFGETAPRSFKEESLGSGVIVTKDGFILTNSHVVEGADEVKVSMGANAEEFTAKVVGRDALTDIAVLKIQANNLPVVTFADSDQIQVGDVALAIGNPFGVGQTVTMGIVSAVKRSGMNLESYEDFIQTDAAINPGNSGGPLVDATGRLMGINTAILSRSGGNQGIGFAVPANMVRNVMEQLIRTGRVVRGYLGVSVQDLTPALAKQFNVTKTEGALVSGVLPRSAAEQAGVKHGDVITQFAGKPVPDSRSLRLMISGTPPGTKAEITAMREGQPKSFSVNLKELPQTQAQATQATSTPQSQAPLEGVSVTDLSSTARRKLDIPADIQGALVTEVEPNVPASDAGLQPGDVIQEINHQPIASGKSATQLSRKLKGKPVLLRVWNESGSRYVLVNAVSTP